VRRPHAPVGPVLLPGDVTLHLDFHNAIGSVSRQALLLLLRSVMRLQRRTLPVAKYVPPHALLELLPTVATATMEAEYMAKGNGTKEALWLRKVVETLYGMAISVQMYCDSAGALAQMHNPVGHQMAKHIDVLHHFLRERSQGGLHCDGRHGGRLAGKVVRQAAA
jgi:hypothetical protein